MPPPVQHYFAKEIVQTIQALIKGFPRKYDQLTKDSSSLAFENNKHATQRLVDFTQTESSRIIAAISGRIQTYISEYQVHLMATGADEVKLAYFTGYSLAFILSESGLDTESKVIMKLAVGMMDHNLAKAQEKHDSAPAPGKFGRQGLKDRLYQCIDKGNLEGHFGDYGAYVAYKCLYNAAIGKG